MTYQVKDYMLISKALDPNTSYHDTLWFYSDSTGKYRDISFIHHYAGSRQYTAEPMQLMLFIKKTRHEMVRVVHHLRHRLTILKFILAYWLLHGCLLVGPDLNKRSK
jgi:hypothetical protein